MWREDALLRDARVCDEDVDAARAGAHERGGSTRVVHAAARELHDVQACVNGFVPSRWRQPSAVKTEWRPSFRHTHSCASTATITCFPTQALVFI